MQTQLRVFYLSLFFTIVTFLGTPYLFGTTIYFANNGEDLLGSINSDGSGFKRIGVADGGIGIDNVNKKLYFRVPGSDYYQSNFDGTQIVSLGFKGVNISVDPIGGKLYVLQSCCGSNDKATEIIKTNLDGTNPETIVTGLNNAFSIDIDKTNEMIYWSEYSDGKIFRSKTDGTGDEIFLPDVESVGGLDIVGDELYFTQEHRGLISRIKLDKTGLEDFSITRPHDVAVDPVSGEIYVTALSTIYQAGKDSFNSETPSLTPFLTLSTFNRPGSIEVVPVPEPSTCLLFILAILSIGRWNSCRSKKTFED